MTTPTPRCRGHLWQWLRDDYTTAVYRCIHCRRERAVWKRRTAAFERDNPIHTPRPDA